MAQKRCKSRVYLVWTRIINELWAHIQRDHIQKWTRVKQWNCEARLQKMKGNLPRRPKNISLYFFIFLFFSFIFFVYLFLCVSSFLFSMFSYVFHFFKFFSVLEGNWINNWRNIQLAIHKMFFSIILIFLTIFVMFNYFCIFLDSFHYVSSIVSIFAYLLLWGLKVVTCSTP